MTREEEYKCTIQSIYMVIRDFIKWSKLYGLRKNELELISDGCTNLLDLITTIATQDVFINRGECLELILYVNKLSNYLKECLEWQRIDLSKYVIIFMINDGQDVFMKRKEGQGNE